MIITFDRKLSINRDFIDSPNLCDRLSENDLAKIGGLVWQGYNRDLASREKWARRMEAGMDLAMQIQGAKNFPWQGCSNVVFPLVTIAALQFSARSYSNIIQGTDVVRYRVVGDDDGGDLRSRADRISKHMSWQVLEEDSSWEEQHDRLLINLSIVGTAFIKSYFSPSLGHNTSELVLARDLVINYWAKSVDSAPRKTHIVPMHRNEIYERVKSKTFAPVLDDGWFNSNPVSTAPADTKHDNRQGTIAVQPDEDTPFRTLEQHRLLDLDGDGYAEPYIVTIEDNSKKVLRIVARVDREEDIDRTADKKIHRVRATEYFTKFPFIPAPDGGIYDVGFGTLLGPLNESVNSGINQLLDAGTMANSQGGFLGRGAKIRGGVYTMAPWEWKRVDSTGDDLRKSLVQLPVREMSNVMFQLLSLLIEYTDRIAGTVDQMVGKNPGQNTPAETSRNTTEQGMQVYSMIFKRVWRSLKEEFKKLHHLNAVYLPQKQRFGAESGFALREDYQSNPDLVVPVADPNVTSNSMRVGQAITIAERSQIVSGYDRAVVEKNLLRALRIEGIDQFYPGEDKVPPLPDAKSQVEQGKLKVKMAEIQLEAQRMQLELREEQKVNNAKIALMEAESIAIMKGMEAEAAAHALEVFNSIINAMKTRNEVINERVKTISEVTGDKGGSETGGQSGGIPAMVNGPGDSGVQGIPE